MTRATPKTPGLTCVHISFPQHTSNQGLEVVGTQRQSPRGHPLSLPSPASCHQAHPDPSKTLPSHSISVHLCPGWWTSMEAGQVGRVTHLSIIIPIFQELPGHIKCIQGKASSSLQHFRVSCRLLQVLKNRTPGGTLEDWRYEGAALG